MGELTAIFAALDILMFWTIKIGNPAQIMSVRAE